MKLDNCVNLAHHCQISNSTIGMRTSIGRYSKIQYAEIGKYCSISWDVTIGALSHPINSITTHAFTYRKQFGICQEDVVYKHEITNINNDVWIGAGVIVLPGVTIGNGAIIGAGAVVTRDVLSYEIVIGCPVRHLRFRFDEKTISKLMNINWWDFKDDIIKNNLDLFSYNNDLTQKGDEILTKLEKLMFENSLNN